MPLSPQTYAANPKTWRMFKTWISFYPGSVGIETPRLTLYRELGKLAINVYTQLLINTSIKLPHPPSGAVLSNNSLISGLQGALSYTPAIGQTPAYIFVSGHFYSTRDIKNPYSSKPVFSGGVLYDIPSGNPMIRAPKHEVLLDVVDLKTAIETALAAAVPASINYEIDKIDYLGLIFGKSGVHFPK